VEYSTWLVAIVITFVSSRRPCDSDAFATSSYDTYFAQPLSAATLVSAAVNVVLPWSICPMVPTFTCGLLRSNFSLAMSTILALCKSPLWCLCPSVHLRASVDNLRLPVGSPTEARSRVGRAKVGADDQD